MFYFSFTDNTSWSKVDTLAKRCCILCDGPARCGSNDKREAFDTLEELHARSLESTEGISKRCCILCDGPARCGSNDKREAVETFAEITGLKL